MEISIKDIASNNIYGTTRHSFYIEASDGKNVSVL